MFIENTERNGSH